jgi:uncharacterized protein YndB with AHSA1/START domain
MMTETIPDVRKEITVEASAKRAFTVFTAHFDSWWPRSHTIGGGELAEAVIEPHTGGRCYQRNTDGSECDWGRVVAYEPPTRLVLAWELSPEFVHDPSRPSEVEVRFVPLAADRTRVELTHRNLDVYGDSAAKLREALDSEGGWSGLLALFGAEVVVVGAS